MEKYKYILITISMLYMFGIITYTIYKFDKIGLPSIIIKHIKNQTSIKKIRYTKKFFLLIDEIITLAIMDRVKQYEMTNKKIKMMNFDKDVNEISTSVYESILSYEYKSDLIIVTPKYIFKYIIQKTEIIYFEYIKENKKDKME